MDISFTPDEVYTALLKKYQDKNVSALPIPALANHKVEDQTKAKPKPKPDTGLSAKEILANTKIEISLEDFCKESPAFHRKMHVAILDTQKKQFQEVMLSGYGAPM
ncbi:hypothetical protein DSO57_1008223 [Entomophthora muscae]|uniref:Uncharacterized protein n=1 Tax=Entomophthora muscae TaxID=34485 RepID=A0ACC2SWB8_9FUNG|nr:hypothetical protein DSO57_1008223 [Entomophthora muscae]